MNATPVIPTASGAVRGAAEDGLAVFRGIPYAANTGGSNRWRPPQAPASWSGVRDATVFGPVCVQNQQWATTVPASEDCLSVNVWTPDTAPAAPAPVLVWIHGGRFIWGAGSEPEFDGAGLAAKGIVVVTVNYRLGVFGFLATSELSAEASHGASGNYGLLDQIAALQWVRENIAAFGGDPGRVTIAGQSAGAASVLTLAYSPRTVGLIHGVIAESGAAHPSDPGLAFRAASYRTLADAEAQGERYLREHDAATIAELRSLPAEALLVGNDVDEPGPCTPRPPLFRPVLDGDVFPRTYTEVLAAGAHPDIPVITGTNKDEDGAGPHPSITLDEYVRRAHEEYGDLTDEFLRLYPAVDDARAAEMSNLAARTRSRVSTLLWAEKWSAHATRPVYTYFWTHAAPGPDADERGAFHAAEIWYFLNSLSRTPRPWTAHDHRIAERMSDYVASFVATGDPNGVGRPEWEPADVDARRTMELGDVFGMIPTASAEQLDFHRRFLEGRPRRR